MRDKNYNEKSISDIIKTMRIGDLDFKDSVAGEYKKKRQFYLINSFAAVFFVSVWIVNTFIIKDIDLKIKKEYVDSYISSVQQKRDFNSSRFYISEKEIPDYPEVEDFYSTI